MLTIEQKQNPTFFSPKKSIAYLDCLGKQIIDTVSAVLDRNGAAASSAGNYRNGFSAIAAEGEKKGFQILIVSPDGLDDIFFSFLCLCQCHHNHPIFLQLGKANCKHKKSD